MGFGKHRGGFKTTSCQERKRVDCSTQLFCEGLCLLKGRVCDPCSVFTFFDVAVNNDGTPLEATEDYVDEEPLLTEMRQSTGQSRRDGEEMLRCYWRWSDKELSRR